MRKLMSENLRGIFCFLPICLLVMMNMSQFSAFKFIIWVIPLSRLRKTTRMRYSRYPKSLAMKRNWISKFRLTASAHTAYPHVRQKSFRKRFLITSNQKAVKMAAWLVPLPTFLQLKSTILWTVRNYWYAVQSFSSWKLSFTDCNSAALKPRASCSSFCFFSNGLFSCVTFFMNSKCINLTFSSLQANILGDLRDKLISR